MLRRRLRYRAWHRGTRELDLLFGPYADAHAEAMNRAGLEALETLMDEEDTDLQAWLMGHETPPEGVDRDLLARVKSFATDKAK